MEIFRSKVCIMKSWIKIIAIFVSLFFVPLAHAASFPSWSSWHYSTPSLVQISGENMEIKLKNQSLSMNNNLNMQRGEKLSILLSFNVGKYSTFAGYKVFLNNESVREKQLVGQGNIYLNISAPENSNYKITLYFYVIQGSLNIHLSNGKIVAVPNSWDEGLLISGIGITTVFGVLGLLSVIMYGMKFGEKKEKNEEEVNKEVQVKKEENTPDEIIAITAAIEAYMHGKKFKILSVEPSPWKYYGRMNVTRRLK